MRTKFNCTSLLAVLTLQLILTAPSAAQVKEIAVKKGWYKDPKFLMEGEKIIIEVKFPDSCITTQKGGYYLEPLEHLSDSIKLAIIGKLLEFKHDTAVCALKVYKYNYEPIESICRGKPESVRFPIQIDALFMINKIVRPNLISLCSCFPVVVNTQSKAELNSKPGLIEQYYSIYEKWYQKALASGKVGEFEFNTPKFSWYGADRSTFTK